MACHWFKRHVAQLPDFTGKVCIKPFLESDVGGNKYELICDGYKKSSPSVFAPMYFYEPMIHRLMKDDDDYYKMFFKKHIWIYFKANCHY